MEPLSLRSAAITDPSMRPILDWIDSYVSWEKLPEATRHDLATRAHAGDEQARTAMENHNLRLVLSRACKRLGRGVELADLMQEGWIGLRVAAAKFDPNLGLQFPTLAAWWIDMYLQDATIKQGRAIYLPHYVAAHVAQIRMRSYLKLPISAEDKDWMDQLGRKLTGNVHLSGVTPEHLDELLNGPRSLDKTITTDHHGRERTTALADMLPASPDPDPSDNLDFETLLPQLVNRGALTRREGWIIVRHCGLDGEGGRSFDAIALELYEAEKRAGIVKPEGKDKPITRERIRQIYLRATAKIRIQLEAKGESYFVSPPAHGTLKEQRKRLSSASITDQSDSTESPKTRSTRRTSVDLSQETAASQPATPLPLRAHASTFQSSSDLQAGCDPLHANSSTKRAKRSSRTNSQVSGVDVPYAEAI